MTPSLEIHKDFIDSKGIFQFLIQIKSSRSLKRPSSLRNADKNRPLHCLPSSVMKSYSLWETASPKKACSIAFDGSSTLGANFASILNLLPTVLPINIHQC